jgi:hypothetical protein
MAVKAEPRRFGGIPSGRGNKQTTSAGSKVSAIITPAKDAGMPVVKARVPTSPAPRAATRSVSPTYVLDSIYAASGSMSKEEPHYGATSRTPTKVVCQAREASLVFNRVGARERVMFGLNGGGMNISPMMMADLFREGPTAVRIVDRRNMGSKMRVMRA